MRMRVMHLFDQMFRVLHYWSNTADDFLRIPDKWRYYGKEFVCDYAIISYMPVPICTPLLPALYTLFYALFDYEGSPWKVAIIIDSILYFFFTGLFDRYFYRSSRYKRLLKRKSKLAKKWYVITAIYVLSPLVLCCLLLFLIF